MAPTQTIQKNIPFKLLNAVTPSDALESAVYGLPTICSFIEIVCSLSAAVATESVTCSIYGAEALAGPFTLIGSALVPANATNIVKSSANFIAFTHIKVILTSVTIVSSSLTVTVNAKDSAGIMASGGSFSGNIIPSLDLTYTLGDATYRWDKLYAFQANLYGTEDDDLGDTAEINVLNTVYSSDLDDAIHFSAYTTGGFSFVQGQYVTSLFAFDTSGYWDIYANLKIGPGHYDPGTVGNPRVLNVSDSLENGTGYTAYSTVFFDSQIRATDLTPTTGVTTLNVRSTFGYGGVATKGTGGPFHAVLNVEGCGSIDSEPCVDVSVLNVNLGTGYTQVTAPGRFWFADWEVFGPIAAQPNVLNGPALLFNNYYNGDAAASPMGAFYITTIKGVGGSDAPHVIADTFPIANGLVIGGYSRASAVDGVGFTKAIQIGGIGSPWGETKSIIGTGIDITQYTTRGIYIHTPIGSPTASIEADGLIKGGSFSAGASAGIDTTITTASLVGKTITVTKGLITGFA